MKHEPRWKEFSIVGAITKYFLRRFAQARSDPRNLNADVAYTTAMLDTVFVFVGLPTLGILSWIIFASLKIAPAALQQWYGSAPRLTGFGLIVFAGVIGHFCFSQRLKRYRHDLGALLSFDSERDRRIVFWQKIAMCITFGAIMPLAGVLLFLK